MSHPAVAEAAAVAAPDEERGAVVRAVVVLRDGVRARRRARPRAPGPRQGRDRALQVPAHRRVRRVAAEDGQRQDQAGAARATAASLAGRWRTASRGRDLALPPAARDNPVDWYPWGDEALAARARRGPADPALDRLLRLPLVPRDGARVVRGRGDRRVHERALRLRQARPRGAARPRRDLHGGVPGDDRARRLAAQRLPHARSRCRSTPAPTSRPTSGGGMPSWRAGARGASPTPGTTKRDEIRAGGDRIAQRLQGGALLHADARIRSTPRGLDAAVEALRQTYDPDVRRLRRRAEVPARLARSSSCCAAARRGMTAAHAARDGRAAGIYDQVGGGFARYSVDDRWLVPHFEKMLYDNALLARAYLHGWQVTGDELFRRVCEETLDWALREMRGPEGGFTVARSTPTPRASRASSTSGRSTSCAPCWATTPTRPSPTSARPRAGNFEGANILTRAASPSPSGLPDDPRSALRRARPSASGRASTTSA